MGCDLKSGIANVVETQYVHQTQLKIRQALATDHHHCVTDVDTLYLEKILLLTDIAGKHVAG